MKLHESSNAAVGYKDLLNKRQVIWENCLGQCSRQALNDFFEARLVADPHSYRRHEAFLDFMQDITIGQVQHNAQLAWACNNHAAKPGDAWQFI